MALHTYGSDGRGLGGAHPLRPPARGAPGAHQGRARGVRHGRAAVLRHDEHPLRHGDPHRHLGRRTSSTASACSPRGDEPIMWDFGSAARHHALYCPWLGEERSRAGISTLRGAMSPASGRAESVAHKIRVELEERGLLGEPVGVDAIEPAVLFALQAEGIQIVDGQQLMQQARVIKTRDEIMLLNHACAMVDAAYEELYRAMRPGIRENECVALVNRYLYEAGLGVRRGRQRDLRRALLAASARVHRPRAASGRPGILRHPALVQRLPDVLLPHVRRGERVARAGRRLQALPLLPGRGDRAHPPRRDHRRGRRGLARGARSSASRTRRRRSRCSSATASASRSGRSRCSAGSSRSTIPRRSRRGWCSRWRRSGRRATAGRRRASRSSSWSPRTARR